MSGKKSKKSEANQEHAEADSGVQAAVRVHEVPRPRLMMALAVTYAVWLSLLVWLACRVS